MHIRKNALNTINLKINKGYSSHYSNKINFKGNTPVDTASEIIKKSYEPDAIIFKVKAKDLDSFKLRHKELLKEGKSTAREIIENPNFIEFSEDANSIDYKEWAALHLQKRGFNVTMPKTENETLKVVLLRAQDAIDEYEFTFEDQRFMKEVQRDAKKAAKATYKAFCKQVPKPYNDKHFAAAADYLKLATKNEFIASMFDNFLQHYNVREFDYKPATTKKPIAQVVHVLDKTLKTLA